MSQASGGNRKRPTAAVNSFSPYRDVAERAASANGGGGAQVATSRIGVFPGSDSSKKPSSSGPVPPPITVFPNDTIVIHYATLDLDATQR